MPAKKKPQSDAPVSSAPKKNEAGVPLGRPAFPTNVLPSTADAARPAGAMQLQVPKGQETPKPGASTLTIMNPSTAATDTSTTKRKRG